MSEHHHGCGCHGGCGEEHHEHHACGCGHDHGHEHEHGCHRHHDHDHGCGCGGHHHDHGCGCGHDHGEQDAAHRRVMAVRIAVCAALWAVSRFAGGAAPVLLLAAYAVMGWDVLWRAARNVAAGRVFDENFLMSVATVGAVVIGDWQEAVFVMLFYQVGELCQGLAVDRSRRSIAALMDIRPETVHLERDGTVETVSPEEAEPGDVMVIHPGERVALDGTVLEGTSSLDTAALTGESVPREVSAGDAVISGCVNGAGVLRVRVERVYGESTVARILELVEHAGEKKARQEAFITRFARVYTPGVVCAALVLAVLPPLLLGGWSAWIHRALIFLVVSCPCALVLSVPLSFFGGIGGASARGILIKGSCYLEQLAKTSVVVFDKTGTLTEGRFAVTEILPAEGVDPEKLLTLAAQAERYSHHPAALALKEACGAAEAGQVTDVQESAGFGVTALVDGARVAVGNRRLMAREGISAPEYTTPGTVIHVSADGAYLGCIAAADRIRDGAAEAIAELKRCGVSRIVMLTGDGEAAAAAAAEQLGVTEYHAGLLPGDKVEKVEALLENKSGTLLFAGDGINDAPVLSRADVGIAMGALGSDAAIEAADVVLMHDDLAGIAAAVRHARRTVSIVRQNVAFALGVKALVLLLAALGRTGMGAAVFADVGVALLTILNAVRALRMK